MVKWRPHVVCFSASISFETFHCSSEHGNSFCSVQWSVQFLLQPPSEDDDYDEEEEEQERMFDLLRWPPDCRLEIFHVKFYFFHTSFTAFLHLVSRPQLFVGFWGAPGRRFRADQTHCWSDYPLVWLVGEIWRRFPRANQRAVRQLLFCLWIS